jgi:hypothetical protein
VGNGFLIYAISSMAIEYFVVNNKTEEKPEVWRKKIIGEAIGLTFKEMENYVTCIHRKGDSDEFIIFFGLETPVLVLSKIRGLQDGLFTHTQSIDFDGLPASCI